MVKGPTVGLACLLCVRLAIPLPVPGQAFFMDPVNDFRILFNITPWESHYQSVEAGMFD